MLTTFNEVDMGAVMELRKAYQDRFVARHGVKLGFMSFFVRAAIEALKEFPQVNAEIDGDEVIFKHHYDIGVAVSGSRGLVVPVVKDADRLGLRGAGEAHRRSRRPRPRGQAHAPRALRWHLHHHQRRHLRLACCPRPS